jgi:hypothetical protein
MGQVSRLLFTLAALAATLTPAAHAQGPTPPRVPARAEDLLHCDEVNSGFCLDPIESLSYEGKYIGHDEPALLFYSDVPGSGNSSVLRLTLPQDPPTPPNQSGTGGTFNFQLHSTFWLGMVVCDSESSPEFTKVCVPDSDANIFDNPDPAAPDYVGHHPGSGYMELQFYPPGWASSPCFDPTHWCAATTITSSSFDQNRSLSNNPECLHKIGAQPFNLAILTRNGVPVAPGNPLHANFGTFAFDPDNILELNSGDRLEIEVRDTPRGVRATIHDLTTGESGSMAAGAATGFGQVIFDPSATLCQINPYDFHPMYSTSTPQTRNTWSGHTVNIAFSNEIGHFELCATADAQGHCTSPGADEKSGLDADDARCVAPPSPALPPPLVQIGGCIGSELDFDGASYQLGWPGAVSAHDQAIHPTPVRFASPRFIATRAGESEEDDDRDRLLDYSRVAFETDLPLVERFARAGCNFLTGAGCVVPPPGAAFYPIYSTLLTEDGCVWQFGGAHIPGTLDTFGGTAAAEYGSLLSIPQPSRGGSVTTFPDFQRALPFNPCPARSSSD